MISKKMAQCLAGDSAIRAMFEEGNLLREKYGGENVFDFSLGNPNFPAPLEIKKALGEIIEEDPIKIHSYMTNAGFIDVRKEIATHLNHEYKTAYTERNIVMTVGAAGGINVLFKTILDQGDEVIAFAPFFAEYKNYVKNFDGELIVVPPNKETFQLNLDEFKALVTPKTKAVIINNPNNPSGVIYSEESIVTMTSILKEKEKEFGHPIFIFSDEPYRDLAYDGQKVAFIPYYYNNTIIGYSWSKSLSVPGQRIGYLTIPSQVSDFENVINGLSVATRILGFVNAPALAQKMVAKCLKAKVDIKRYDENRIYLYQNLKDFGYCCIKPQGAFYLFVKSPIADEKKFCNMAKEFNILIVPGSAFSCPGYVRLAYCVSKDTIKNSLPKFKQLLEKANSLEENG